MTINLFKKLLLTSVFVLLSNTSIFALKAQNRTMIIYDYVKYPEETKNEKYIAPWIDFAKQVAITGAVTIGGLALYQFVGPNDTLLGLMIFFGGGALIRDLSKYCNVKNGNESIWAQYLGWLLGRKIYNERKNNNS
ncbi:MAG: hypothetical protein WA432_02180 [Candidatus Babeliaceae bacterium]